MAVDQSHRFLKIHTIKPDDAFILHKFSGHEKLGNLFEYHLSLFTDLTEDLFDALLGTGATVEMQTKDDGRRYFHGFITDLRFLGRHGELLHYQATLRPWLWFLGRVTDCRIYQEQTAVQIIEQVFSERGFSDFRNSLTRTYDAYEYCVQYRETYLNFVLRLMEQEGIYFYFEHNDGNHKLVLADDLGAHRTVSGYETIIYRPPGESYAGQEHIHSWATGKEVVSSSVTLNDYNFTTPRVSLIAQAQKTYDHAQPGSSYEVYDYPGEYKETAGGEKYAANWRDEMACRFARSRGSGNARCLSTGYLFTLDEYPHLDQNQQFLVVSASYDIQSDEVETSAATGGDIYFHCDFEAMRSNVRYVSPRITPKPLVQGLQTAEVVGPDNEEIHTDQYGRIKVKFHWDRAEVEGENRTCFMRFSTNWAGKNWGTIHIPRIGQEVVVSFLEGDPDRPLVTGSVYNADHMPPWELPKHMTMSGIKSHSTKEGQRDNFNEIRFEDEKEKEELRIQAENHMNVGVKHIRHTYIGSQLPELDDGARGQVSNTVNPLEGARCETCAEIGTVIDLLTVFADRKTVIKGNDILEIAEDPGGQANTENSKQGRCMTVHNGNYELIVKQGDQITKVETGNKTIDVDTGNMITTVSTRDYTVNVNAGKITMDAAQSIELIVGSSSIKLEPSQITLTAVQVFVDGQAKARMSAPTVEVNASALAQIEGSMVKIN